MTITVQNASEIKNVQGMPRNTNAKPVFCIDTGEVFASVTDAAVSVNANPSTMSWCLTERQKTCKGKRYCYLSKVIEHLDEIAECMRERETKLKAYDELVKQQSESKPIEPVIKVVEKPVIIYKAPETRKVNNPLRKAKEIIISMKKGELTEQQGKEGLFCLFLATCGAKRKGK